MSYTFVEIIDIPKDVVTFDVSEFETHVRMLIVLDIDNKSYLYIVKFMNKNAINEYWYGYMDIDDNNNNNNNNMVADDGKFVQYIYEQFTL